ncbi:MAG: hypothetical protein IJQ28_01105, partial [Clostridia bacterium]|nr:hypothetical protein [Clostridia bacterium]
MIKKLISLTIAVGIICIFFFTDVLAEPQLEDFGEYPIVLADMNFDDLNTGTIIDKNTDPDKYFFKDDKTGPGGNDDGITPAVEIVEKDSRKYAKVITYTNANEAFGVSAKVTQDSLVENGLTEYPDKIKVEYDIMKDGHNQAVYGFIGHSSPIANAAKDWGEFMQWGAGNTFSFARQMSAPVTISTAVAVGTWAHVDLYFDFTARTFDCFVNGTYLGKAELKPGMTTPEYLSFSCYTNNKETSNLCVDNIKISAERALVSIYQEDMETGDASMNVKHRTLVESPVDPDHHGKVLKLPFSASSDNYCMPRHSVIENSFAGGKLKKIRASFDILFEDYASASITLYSSETLPSGSKNYFTLMQFTKDGKCKTDNYDLSYRASSTWRHLRDEGYSLGKWYNIKTELDIDSQTFSLFIDDELIAQNVSFKTSANVPLIDFLTYRIQISRNTVENAPDGYVYADNFKYEIPYSQLYDHTGIYTHIDDKLLTVDAVAIGEDSAALWAARFENDVLADFARINAKLIDNMLFARYNCEVQEGSEYKFFLFDGPSSIRPLADKVEYRSFSESDYRQVIENWR